MDETRLVWSGGSDEQKYQLTIRLKLDRPFGENHSVAGNEILSIMKKIATAIWCIRAGQTGEADTLFLAKSVVALGLAEIGSLDISQADLTLIKLRIRKLYPTKTPTAVARNANQLFHFFHDISIGDLMIYP